MTTTSFLFGSRQRPGLAAGQRFGLAAGQRFGLAAGQRFGLAAGLAILAAACGGSGGGSSASLALVESNLNNLQHWQLNRTMTFRFDRPVDLNSVNLNTISILREGVTPAAGSFFLIDAYTVAFQPTCPSQAGFADAGLTPGGYTYIVHVVGSTDGGATVQSLDGQSLGLGLTTQIITPDSDDLAVLFDDIQPGPPSPLVWSGTGPTAGFSYLEEGGNPDARIFFEPRTVPSLALGADVPAGYVAPLNLYSVDESRLGIFVQIDQPVDPSASNISPTTVKLQYCSDPAGGCGTNPSQWADVAHEVELLANCVDGGATIHVTPVGILPQGRIVRVVLASSFRDLVGNGNLLDLTVGSFEVDTALDPDTMLPIQVEDEFLEPFLIPGGTPGSTQDFTALLDAPAAHWGQAADPGDLVAGFDFGGTGGPGGDFDWVIEQLPGNSSVILNTSFSVITNADQTATQTVVNGQVDVRNLTINAGGVLEIKGPNACTIRASGTVTINGKIVIKGSNNLGTNTFNTTNIPAPGASGNGGGGRGGTANILTTQSTPAGENGYGAFDAPNGGGGGGESGYNPGSSLDNRRPGGGGGGALGPPMTLFTPAVPFNVNGCPDQRVLGLDAEDGNPGALNASGATGGPGQRPRGGLKGPRPFNDASIFNDFTGIMRSGTTIVRGELVQAWAGAGGGGGGNAITASTFPNPSWTPAGDEKGAGGGGGGGSLTLLVLGDVIFGIDGRIDAGGGTGGGGENSNGNNRIGGGSGAGSAGHVILQVGRTIDFRLVRTNQPLERNRGGIWARGGQGGAGREDRGGAMSDGVETAASADRLPRDHYPIANGGVVDPAPCAVAAANPTNTATGFGTEGIAGCGGDGGPGIIQLHAPTLGSILTPNTGGETLSNCLKPNPVGTTITFGPAAQNNTSNVNTPNSPTTPWNQLLPSFGRVSKAQSRWIALGATSVSPTSTLPEPTEFVFDGLTPGGLVETTGGAGAVQIELPSIFNGPGTQTVVAEPNTPFVTDDDRTIVFDGTTVTDEVYLNNPSLLRMFDLKFVAGATTVHFDVGSATYDTTSGLLRVTVTGSGTPLSVVPSDGSAVVSLHPRFYRVKTDGVLDALPDPASIQIEFQATLANSVGAPDESAGALTAWTSDVAVLNSDPENALFRFFRFRVTFDLGLTTLSADTPVPALDYLRVPFRF